MADIVIALSEAQEQASKVSRECAARGDAANAAHAREIHDAVKTIREEFRTLHELPAARAREVVEQLRGMLTHTPKALHALHPTLVRAMASMLRAAEE